MNSTARSDAINDSEAGEASPVSDEFAPYAEPAAETPSESGGNDSSPAPVTVNVDETVPEEWEADPLNPFEPQGNPLDQLRELGGDLQFSEEGRLLVADLTETQTTDEHVDLLQQFKMLQAVDLTGTQVTNACLKKLSGSPTLEMLALGDTQVDDQGLRDIVDMEHLRFLSLERTKVTDDGLRYLKALDHLEGLSLRGTQVTQQAVRDFQRANPDCRVLSDYDEENSSLQFRPEQQSFEDFAELKTITNESPWPHTSLGPKRLPPRVRATSIPSATDDPKSAVEHLQHVISERLNDPHVLAAAGKVYLSQKRWSDAVAALTVALQQDPGNHRVRFDLAVASGHAGDIEASLHHFTEIIGSAAAHYNLGVLLCESGDVSMGRYFLRQARQRDPRIEIPDEMLPQFAYQDSPGINLRPDAIPAVSSGELLQLLAKPVHPRHADENWSIEIVPSYSPGNAPHSLTSLPTGDAVSQEPVSREAIPASVQPEADWASPIGWTAPNFNNE